MLTPEDIKFIVDWAAAGNEPRRAFDIPSPVLRAVESVPLLHKSKVRLNSAGLTIAALAKALEQANATGETCLYRLTGQHHPNGLEGFVEMRATKKELLG